MSLSFLFFSSEFLRVTKQEQEWKGSLISADIASRLLLSIRLLEVQDGSLNLATILLLLVIQFQKPLQQEEAETTEHRSSDETNWKVDR